MIPRRPAPWVVLGVIWVAVSCRSSARETTPPDLALPPARELLSPAAAGSGEPNLAVGPDGSVYLSWIEPAGESAHQLRFATRKRGAEWSEARTIAKGERWFVNWADFPAVLALPDGTLAAHWLARNGPSTYAYEVRVAISRDGGRTWSAGTVPHRDGTATEHGFVSLFPWDAGRAGLVWLDGRKTAGQSGHAGTAEMALMHTTIAADGSLGPENLLDPRVCDCCQTAVAVTADATIVAYRDRSAAEVRDIATVRYADGRWSEPVVVGADNWEIHGCPVNGPALAAEGARVALAWFSAPAEQGRVQLALSSDSGRTFGRPVRVDDGRPIGRVDVVVLPGGDAIVSWLEQAAKGAEVRARRITAAGLRGPALTLAQSSEARSSGFPRLERSAREVTVAWRDAADPPRVRTAVLDLPS